MFCICLNQELQPGYGNASSYYTYTCITKESFLPTSIHVNDVCKNPDEFKNCQTYKEWTRIQGAPKTIKILTFLIPILTYLVLFTILLTLGKITIYDWKIQILGVIPLIMGWFWSTKV